VPRQRASCMQAIAPRYHTHGTVSTSHCPLRGLHDRRSLISISRSGDISASCRYKGNIVQPFVVGQATPDALHTLEMVAGRQPALLDPWLHPRLAAVVSPAAADADVAVFVVAHDLLTRDTMATPCWPACHAVLRELDAPFVCAISERLSQRAVAAVLAALPASSRAGTMLMGLEQAGGAQEQEPADLRQQVCRSKRPCSYLGRLSLVRPPSPPDRPAHRAPRSRASARHTPQMHAAAFTVTPPVLKHSNVCSDSGSPVVAHQPSLYLNVRTDALTHTRRRRRMRSGPCCRGGARSAWMISMHSFPATSAPGPSWTLSKRLARARSRAVPRPAPAPLLPAPLRIRGVLSKLRSPAASGNRTRSR
jgi:hypothetical protein